MGWDEMRKRVGGYHIIVEGDEVKKRRIWLGLLVRFDLAAIGQKRNHQYSPISHSITNRIH